MRSRRRGKCILCGNLNTKSVVWGGELTDNRGERTLDMVIHYGMEIINDRRELPTFETTNGRSWIDLTLPSDNNIISNWQVIDEENLTDHRYIVCHYWILK